MTILDWTGAVLSVGLGSAMLAGLARVARGPSVADRILGFDMLSVAAAGLMGVLSLVWRTALFLELILVFTMLGFMGTVALVVYLQKSDRELAGPPEDFP